MKRLIVGLALTLVAGTAAAATGWGSARLQPTPTPGKVEAANTVAPTTSATPVATPTGTAAPAPIVVPTVAPTPTPTAQPLPIIVPTPVVTPSPTGTPAPTPIHGCAPCGRPVGVTGGYACPMFCVQSDPVAN